MFIQFTICAKFIIHIHYLCNINYFQCFIKDSTALAAPFHQQPVPLLPISLDEEDHDDVVQDGQEPVHIQGQPFLLSKLHFDKIAKKDSQTCRQDCKVPVLCFHLLYHRSQAQIENVLTKESSASFHLPNWYLFPQRYHLVQKGNEQTW